MKTSTLTMSFVGIVVLASIAGCLGSEPGIALQPTAARSSEALALQQEEYTGNIYPFFEEYCFSCHGIRKTEAGIDLRAATDVSTIGQREEVWRRVLTMIETAQMPPADERQPTAFDREDIAGFVEAELDASIRAMQPDPGRVTARRLNRHEYEYTVLDLLGVETKVARSFPVDDSGYGFDNIGDVLSISPLLMEKYMSAAEEVASAAIKRELIPPTEGENRVERRILVCGHAPGAHVDGCAKAIVREFATRAYRRPVTKTEVKQLVDLARLVEREGGGFEEGIQLAVETVLISPKFLFRLEQDQDPRDPDYLRYVNDYELASRLSYFLWSSMPDAELFALAEVGTLREPEVLSAAVTRMIADPKAMRFVQHFAGQWLELRNLDVVSPDRELYPAFRGLRSSMRKESELYFEAMLREDRDLLEFLMSDFTFVDEQLAKHYGIEGVTGKDHQRVTVDGVQRGGVLTQASVLTLTSHPTRTSPVLRGAWVLENILGTAPPPPPDDVPALEEDPEKLTGTLREQLEVHRANPSCASCHARIDPLGFGLENYDAIGAWRTHEREFPVNSKGTLPSGESFEGSAELRATLLADSDDFVRCFTEKVLTYALGRGVESFDRPVVAGIVDRVEADGYRFQVLMREVVASVPFQMRRGEGDDEIEVSLR